MRRIIRTPTGGDALIERATADDLVSLATDVGPSPNQVGAVLLLEPGPGFDAEAAVALIDERTRGVPRLRQRLLDVPVGCGRPIWVDDAAFDIAAHVAIRPCPAPGDEAALLSIAADVLGRRLPVDRPLWRFVMVTGLAGGRVAIVVVFHHVLADGIGGLAVLAQLVDGVAVIEDRRPVRPEPSRRALVADAAAGWLAAVSDLPASVVRLRGEVAALRHQGVHRATRCSINVPIGGRRRFTIVRIGLEAVHDVAHARGATVNDVVLTAVAGALGDLLAVRGEDVERFVVSVPVSARDATAGPTELGNRVGVLPVEVPATGEPLARLAQVVAATSEAKARPRVGAGVFGFVSRLMARLGVFGWFINHQGMIHTLVTNLRGPATQLTFDGAPIVEVIPLSMLAGNVAVAFAVLSYAGQLTVTVIADPDAVPDLDRLGRSLDDHLHRLVQDDGTITARPESSPARSWA